jgi:hypothetical protein
VPFLCVKLVAEPARLWLWLVEGERIFGRREVLRRALERMPEEELALRRALELERTLERRPAPPLAEVLNTLLRLSARLATRMATEVVGAGTTTVELVWEGAEGVMKGPRTARLLPLVDWRACAAPARPDETLALVETDARDPSALASLAADCESIHQPVVAVDQLLVLPTASGGRAKLRCIQCALTDPVSLALVAGETHAVFPNVAGWSARDWARRAVAEHRAWLETPGRCSTGGHEWLAPPMPSTAIDGRTLAMLLTAARAGLFQESLERGSATLLLTVAAIAQRLGPIADETVGSYSDWRARGSTPAAGTVERLRAAVRALPAYNG